MLCGAASSFHPGTAHVRARRMIAVIGARSRISRHACCHVCRARRGIFATPFIFLTPSDTIWGPSRVAAIFSQSPRIRLLELIRRRTWWSCERLSVRAQPHVVAQNDGQNNHRRCAGMMLGRRWLIFVLLPRLQSRRRPGLECGQGPRCLLPLFCAQMRQQHQRNMPLMD